MTDLRAAVADLLDDMDADPRSICRAMEQRITDGPTGLDEFIICRFCDAQTRAVYDALNELPEDGHAGIRHKPTCSYRRLRRLLDGVA